MVTIARMAAAPAANNNQPLSINTSTPLTLEAAILIAWTDNPNLKAAAANVEAAVGRAWQLGRWSNPELGLAIEEWPVSTGGAFSDAKQTIGISQQLPWPGKKRHDRALGQAGLRRSQSELALLKTEVTRDVKAAFYRVLAAQASIEAGEELLRIAQSSADAARKRVESGATPYQEELRAEIQLAQARNEVADLRLEAAAARHSLFTLLGRPDLSGIAVAGSLSNANEESWLELDPEQWQERHPSFIAAAARLHQAEAAARRARLEAYPDITAGVDGGRLGETDASIVEFALSIPLPVLDSSKGRKAEAAADVVSARAEIEAVGQALHREWNKAMHRYRTAGEQVASYRDQVLPKSREALRLVQTGFEEGKFGFIDLIDIQRTFAESQLAYQQKLLNLNVARAELEALTQPCPVAAPARTKD